MEALKASAIVLRLNISTPNNTVFIYSSRCGLHDQYRLYLSIKRNDYVLPSGAVLQNSAIPVHFNKSIDSFDFNGYRILVINNV